MHDNWFATPQLRWFEVGDFTFPNYKKTLQQLWRRYPATGSYDEEWRDVPLVTDE